MEKFNTGDRVIVTYNGATGTIAEVYTKDYYLVRFRGSSHVYHGKHLGHDNGRSMFINLSVSLLLGFQTFVIFAMNDLDVAGMIGGLAMYVTSFMVLKKQR
jgi:hypothetical protein